MKKQFITETLRTFLQTQDFDCLKELLTIYSLTELADALLTQPIPHTSLILMALPSTSRINLFNQCPHQTQIHLANTLKPADLSDLLSNLSQDKQTRICSALSPALQLYLHSHKTSMAKKHLSHRFSKASNKVTEHPNCNTNDLHHLHAVCL